MRNRWLANGAMMTAFTLLTAASTFGATPPQQDWRAALAKELPLLGHRNWIVIVDSAYPLQTSSGIETIETNSEQIEVVREVLGQISRASHVEPTVYTDAELPFVPEQEAHGITAYRSDLKIALGNREMHSLPHQELIDTLDKVGKTFHILVLKTRLTLPYTSVFLQLDCKYWSAENEQQLREAMKSSSPH
jgi:hypothetical protein